MEYRTSSGEVLLTGTVVIDTSPTGISGIRCQCCGDVISCSQFEAHAGWPQTRMFSGPATGALWPTWCVVATAMSVDVANRWWRCC